MKLENSDPERIFIWIYEYSKQLQTLSQYFHGEQS